MSFRRTISLLLLSVYLTSICGYALTILLCHCPHSRHYETCHKACCHCSVCDHTDPHADGINGDDRCNCKHNHTTEIDLYDIAKQIATVVSPVVSDCIIQPADDADRLFASVEYRLFRRRKIPLPHSPARSQHSLRAPPVSA